MLKTKQTEVSALRMRTKMLAPQPPEECPQTVEWSLPQRRKRGEALLKNLAVASALVLCAVTLRTGAVPHLSDAADAVLTAATDNSLLDEQLGKLSFVSTLFPEAVLVFGENSEETLSVPVSGGVVIHTWSEAEPYMSWETASSQVSAAAAGEVIGVYHGNGDERLVQVMGHDGLACLYGNLEDVYVQTGDAVSAGDVLGQLIPGAEFVFEVRRDGLSIDPALYLSR